MWLTLARGPLDPLITQPDQPPVRAALTLAFLGDFPPRIFTLHTSTSLSPTVHARLRLLSREMLCCSQMVVRYSLFPQDPPTNGLCSVAPGGQRRAGYRRPSSHDRRAPRAPGQAQAPTASGCRGGRCYPARALGTGARTRYGPPCLAPRCRGYGLARPRCRPSAAEYGCRHGSLPARSAPRALGGVHCAPGVSSAASAGRGSATGLRAGSARRRARSTGARGAAGAVCTPTRGAARGVCETGYAATTGGDATAARARARRRGGCRCEQRSDRYYRFTLEGEAAPPPMPPINGLCNSRLCRPHLRP
jgi:hypothetical protein